MTLDVASEGFLAWARLERGLAQNTLASYARDLNSFGTFLAEQGLEELGAVQRATLTDYLDWLQQRGCVLLVRPDVLETLRRGIDKVLGLNLPVVELSEE